jgi:signal transduction histidine kinase
MPDENATQKTRTFGFNPYRPRKLKPLGRRGSETRPGRARESMKPLKTELQDDETLRALGSASVQIVHDLKNQLNGLKLYATFLRKRMEKGERPADELETMAKLIQGLERAASDMTLLVRYGRPVELKRQPGTDLARLLSETADGLRLEAAAGPFEGEFDPTLLAEALKNITKGGRAEGPGASEVSLRREEANGGAAAVIEWRGLPGAEGGDDPFRSFNGGSGLRLALAARIIREHGGETTHDGGTLRASLPLTR